MKPGKKSKDREWAAARVAVSEVLTSTPQRVESIAYKAGISVSLTHAVLTDRERPIGAKSRSLACDAGYAVGWYKMARRG